MVGEDIGRFYLCSLYLLIVAITYLLRLFTSIAYLCTRQARRLEMTVGEKFVPNPTAAASSTNVMDAWIQATLQGLVQVEYCLYLKLSLSNSCRLRFISAFLWTFLTVTVMFSCVDIIRFFSRSFAVCKISVMPFVDAPCSVRCGTLRCAESSRHELTQNSYTLLYCRKLTIPCLLPRCFVQFVHTEMKAYRLYTVVPRLVGFIEQLTNWYVRLNRNRLKGAEGTESARTGEVRMDVTCLARFV